MKVAERVAKYLADSKPEAAPLVETFPDVAEAQARERTLRARCREQEARLSEISRALQGEPHDSDGLDKDALTLASGGDVAPRPSMSQEREQLQRSLEVSRRAHRIAMQELNQLRQSKSEEVVRVVRAQHRAMVREMARLVAQAGRLAEEEGALRSKLQRGGIDLGEAVPALAFSPLIGRDFGVGPLATWISTLQRYGVVGANEDPAAIPPWDRAGALQVEGPRKLGWADLRGRLEPRSPEAPSQRKGTVDLSWMRQYRK